MKIQRAPEAVLEEYADVLKELGVERPWGMSVVDISKVGKDVVVSTELWIVRYSTKAKKRVWTHDCHHDVIISAAIEKDRILVKEFDNKTYSLDLKTGKLV